MIKVAVTPEVNAVSTLLMALTLTLVLVATRLAPDIHAEGAVRTLAAALLAAFCGAAAGEDVLYLYN